MCQNRVFFSSATLGICNFNGTSIVAIYEPYSPQDGNPCAYVPGIARVQACPAQTNVCWSWNDHCDGIDNTRPGPTQEACNEGDQFWCCNQEWETCAGKEGQTDICWAKLPNPIGSMSTSEALAFKLTAYSTLAALATSMSTSTTPSKALTSDPTTYSTLIATVTSPSSSTPTSSGLTAAHTTITTADTVPKLAGSVAGIAIACAGSGIRAAALIGTLIQKWLPRRQEKQQQSVIVGHETYADYSPNEVAPVELPPDHALAEADGTGLATRR